MKEITLLYITISFLFISSPLFADDYYSTNNKSLIGENSPSAKYNTVREMQKHREIFNNIHRKQKYTYQPYSSSVYQKRRSYDPKETDWSDPWYN